MRAGGSHSVERSRAKAIVALAVMVLLSAWLLSSGGGNTARADTTATPDTNTRAVLNPNPTPPQTCNPTPPTQAATPCATSSNGTLPGNSASFSGVNGGDTLSIHIDGSAGTFFGTTRTALCRGSLTDVELSAQIVPSNGDCVPGGGLANGEPANGNHSAGGSQPPNTYVDYTFKIGEGTYTPPGGTAITCDGSNPCTIWIQESVSNSDDGSGFVFKHYTVNYASGVTTTTTTAPTTTTTTTAPTTTTTTTAPTTTTTTAPTTTTTTTAPTTTTTTTAPTTTTTTTAPTTTTTTMGSTATTALPLRVQIRCEVLETEIATIQRTLESNSSLPPLAERLLTHRLNSLEKQAKKAHCDPPGGQAGNLPASPPAQAVPMQFSPFFPAWFLFF